MIVFGIKQSFPDLHDQVIQIYPSGDKHIIVEFVFSGTAPDNSKFELPICTILTTENGIITKGLYLLTILRSKKMKNNLSDKKLRY
jgi:hypothetical protein